MFILLLLIWCLNQGPIPSKIYLVNGQWLPNDERLVLKQNRLELKGLHGIRYTLPLKQLDLVRSFRVAMKPKQPQQVAQPKRIPWHDPQFAHKQKSDRHLALTTDGLITYVKEHPYLPNPELEELFDADLKEAARLAAVIEKTKAISQKEDEPRKRKKKAKKETKDKGKDKGKSKSKRRGLRKAADEEDE